MNGYRIASLALVGAVVVTAAVPSWPGNAADDPAPELTESFLKDPDNIAIGEAVWKEQCRHCHGSAAYPGKAPKLKPRRYKPEFVYDTVTNGFRRMPAWEEVYSRQERMGVVAYILSRRFSP